MCFVASKSKLEILIGDSYHSTESPAERPSIRLRDWQVAETTEGARHFIGYDIEACEGRASTAIVRFDARTRVGVTTSGRTYELVGPTGRDEDAHYVWGIWSFVNGVTTKRDASDEYK